jgi:hypothetical protein
MPDSSARDGNTPADARPAEVRPTPVRPEGHRHRPSEQRAPGILAGAAVLAYLLWPYPTGRVVIGLALALLFALGVVDFLATRPRRKDSPT